MIPTNINSTQITKFENSVYQLLNKISNLVLYINNTENITVEDNNFHFLDILELVDGKHLYTIPVDDSRYMIRKYIDAWNKIYDIKHDYKFIISAMVQLSTIIDYYFTGHSISFDIGRNPELYLSANNSVIKFVLLRLNEYLEKKRYRAVSAIKLDKLGNPITVEQDPIDNRRIDDVKEKLLDLIYFINHTKEYLEKKCQLTQD